MSSSERADRALGNPASLSPVRLGLGAGERSTD